MKTNLSDVDTAIQTLRDLNEDFQAINDPTIRLQMWARMEVAMKMTKAAEMAMRKEAFAAFFKHDKGTENLPLGDGYTLKGVAELNYKVDKEKVDDTLDGIEKLGERGALIAEKIVKFTPEVSVTELNRLRESKDPVDLKALAMIETVITTTPGSPTLSIVPPKT